MYRHSIPYKRRGLYCILTAPMVIMYIVIGYHLYTIDAYLVCIYCTLFILTIIFQSYNCLYWRCPHVGTFCPGAGGFCAVSSPIALLLIKLNVKESKTAYNVLCTLAYINFFGLILFPVYFMYKLNPTYVLIYCVIILLYFMGMMLLICPFCGAKNVCPGGQTASRLVRIVCKNRS